MDAKFSHGNPRMIDYTPVADTDAGKVIVVGSRPMIVHIAISANRLGAYAQAGGVYDVAKTAAGSGQAIANETLLYWDDTNKVATTSSASGVNKVLGYSVQAALTTDTTVRVYHTSA